MTKRREASRRIERKSGLEWLAGRQFGAPNSLRRRIDQHFPSLALPFCHYLGVIIVPWVPTRVPHGDRAISVIESN